MARRVSRPAALRITWVVAPWGVSANMATLAAWACGVAAACALAWGTVAGWLAAAGLLQLWYLADHVDGQLARLRGTSSLDGVQLDYLMHHTLNLLIPLGAGFGLFVCLAEPLWLIVGTLWGVSLLLITLRHDARYKAFVGRLKRLEGRLEVVGGGGGRPQPQPALPRAGGRLAACLARKACETHVVMNLITAVAIGQWVLSDTTLAMARVYVAFATATAMAVTVWTIVRSQRGHEAEQEFARWYRVPEGSVLVFVDGRWVVMVGQAVPDVFESNTSGTA